MVSQDLNVWNGEGIVGSDPKIAYVGEKNTPKLSFMLANHRAANGDGKERVIWIPCVMWGARGEKLAEKLSKGMRVTVSGLLDIRSKKQDDGTWSKYDQIACTEVNIKGMGKARKTEEKPKEEEVDPFSVEDSTEAEKPAAVETPSDVDNDAEDDMDW